MKTKRIQQLVATILLASAAIFTTLSARALTSVTFKVDMTNVTSAYTTPEVRGTFTASPWNNAVPMTDANNDDIWEATVQLPAGSYEYKFAADGWAIQETLTPGSSCTMTTGSYTNRKLTVAATPLVLPAVCWSYCVTCANAVPPRMITFKVDMQSYGSPVDTVNINGTFNGWCGKCNQLTDANGDNIWETTIPIIGDSIEYLFTVKGWADKEALIAGMPCSKSNGTNTNRFLKFNGDTVLSPVCWESCATCIATKNVTFKVNMATYTGAYTDVNLNGTFNGWCGSCNTMTDANNDKIYEITLPLPVGPIQYKFSLDGWGVAESFTGGEPCTITSSGLTNRVYTVANTTAIPTACWNTCSDCPAGIDELDGISIGVYPNPASSELTISTTLTTGTAFITNILGAVVSTSVDLSTTKNIDISTLSPGAYYLNVTTGGQKATVVFVKK
jgi:hypothetical protein